MANSITTSPPVSSEPVQATDNTEALEGTSQSAYDKAKSLSDERLSKFKDFIKELYPEDVEATSIELKDGAEESKSTESSGTASAMLAGYKDLERI